MTDITTKLRSGNYGVLVQDLNFEAADEIDRLRAEVATADQRLGNLMAVIHRDGGHYQTEHGTEKACADAETAVHVLRGSLEGYVEANRYMKGELDDALEDARKYCEAQREIARLREALALTASYPLEQFGIGDDHTDLQPLFGANNWQITVGDVRKARAALAPVEVGK